MTYVPKEWETGDVISAEDLNHIENGIGKSILILHPTFGERGAVTLDKTWQEIWDAVGDGKIVMFYQPDNELSPSEYVPYTLNVIQIDGESTYFTAFFNAFVSNGYNLTCASADDYPTNVSDED